MATYSPVAHPLGPPVVSGNTLSVDQALNQPSRVTRMIMDLTLQRFIADRIFASGGGVTGGAVVYDEVLENELYTSRDIGRVAPGSEFPIVTSERLAPKVAEVEKWGGKFFITDEARDRNAQALFINQVRRLANTVVRKLNQRAIETLEEYIGTSRDVTGTDWSAAILEGSSATAPTARPSRDFAHAQRVSDEEELGIDYDTWLINPQEYESLAMVYGGELTALLQANGIRELYSSNRVAPGTAFAVARQQVGEQRIEKPLSTITWREDSTERTWTQTSVRPLWFANNKFAVLRFTGLNG